MLRYTNNIFEYRGHLPRVFVFKHVFMAPFFQGTKKKVPRDAEPAERPFVVGLVEDPKIDPSTTRHKSTRVDLLRSSV